MVEKILTLALITLLVWGCQNNGPSADASGNFEADEIIVSAEQAGKILSLHLKEGDTISANSVVGQIDVTGIGLQKEQVEASLRSLRQKMSDPGPQLELVRKQIAVLQTQLEQQLRERERTAKLLAADAATGKQLDDIESAISQIRRQIAVSEQQLELYRSSIATQNRSILSEEDPLRKSAERIQDQINRGQIINPIKGTVLVRYAYAGEMTAPGKPLYSIANLDTITLKAFVSGSQLPQIKLNQEVDVRIDEGADRYKNYGGRIYWISDKAEFTPRTIQTKDERANLVYALRIAVKNDGFLKIGMYGEVQFKQHNH